MYQWRLPSIAAITLSLVATTLSVTPVAASEDDPQYYLPAPEGTALVVAQGNDARSRRTDDERYAFDFAAADGPTSFEVVAARGGTVMAQRSGVRGRRCVEPAGRRRPACWRSVNFVLIDHGDGTSGLYLHLKRGDPIVRRGQVIARGQPIGFAGRSGWTDTAGVQFQVQPTPSWNDWGTRGWFQTASQPVSFSDSSVLDLDADGVPERNDLLISGNGPPVREPFRFARRSVDLPATVPLEIGEPRFISDAYDADSPDGYGVSFAPLVEPPPASPTPDAPASPDASTTPDASAEPAFTDPGTVVRPLFAGELVYAGCATGASASLGRMVVVRQDLDDGEHYAILGHLSDIEPTLLDQDPEFPLQLGANELLGHYGVILAPDETPVLECPDADPGATDLFAAILRDATVSPEGEISGGTPVSPEPLLGRGGYEGLAWWSGPVTARNVDEDPGRPRFNWTRRTPSHASRIKYGDAIRLVARVRDATDIREVRFRAYYPRWPRVGSSRNLDSFDPRRTWRQLAVCRPRDSSGQPRRTRACQWDGDGLDAVVSYSWDPSAIESESATPWLPAARPAITRASDTCVPVSFGVEVVDKAGRVRSELAELPLPNKCNQRAIDRSDTGRVLYLDPLTLPPVPVSRGRSNEDRAFPYDETVYGPDPLNGNVAWRDRADNEDGYYVYVRRNWLLADCSTAFGRFVRVATLPQNSKRYKPRHQRNLRLAPAPNVPDVPGSMTRYEMYVSAFNEAGETKRVPLGGFIAGGEAFCDTGLVPPPDL